MREYVDIFRRKKNFGASLLSLCGSAGFRVQNRLGPKQKWEMFRFALRALSPLQNCDAGGRGLARCVCFLLRFNVSPAFAYLVGLFVVKEITTSFARSQDARRASDTPDVLPSTPQTPFRSDAPILADELAESADHIKWPRMA